MLYNGADCGERTGTRISGAALRLFFLEFFLDDLELLFDEWEGVDALFFSCGCSLALDVVEVFERLRKFMTGKLGELLETCW